MAKESGSKREVDSASSLEGQIAKASEEHGAGVVWVREDGAICVGAECMVIKPNTEGKELTIEIAPDKCGELTGEALADAIYKTIGRGGTTTFKVKGKIEEGE